MSAAFLIKDLWGQLRTKPSLIFSREYQPAPPYFINLEPTSFCNLKCKICSLDGSRKNGQLSPETAIKSIEQARQLKVTEIRFFLAGEPFFNPHLAEYVKMAKDSGIITNIHTNATFMPEERMKAVLEAGLDKISFSFDGETAEEYEKIRIGGKFDITFANIIRFLELKKQRGGKFPLVTIQVIKLFGTTDCGIISKEFRNRFSGLPVDEFLLLNPFVWPGTEEQSFHRPAGGKFYPCMTPWNSLSVAWDGRVLWCCGDLNGVGTLGNIHERTLKEIWNGPEIRALRRSMHDGRPEEFPLCKGCQALLHRHNPVFSDLKDYIRQAKRFYNI